MTMIRNVDLGWPTGKPKDLFFRYQTRCVASLFGRLLLKEKVKTKECWKIIIYCSQRPRGKLETSVSGVYIQEVKAKPEEFFKLSKDFEKQQWALDVLWQGIESAAKQAKWPIKPFEKVRKRIIELKFVNEMIWKKPVKSPNGKYFASVHILHLVHECEISIIIKDRSGTEILREVVLHTKPHELMYAPFIQTLFWKNQKEIVLLGNGKKPTGRALLHP